MNAAAGSIHTELDVRQLLGGHSALPAVNVRHITDDSRQVAEGSLFIAVQGQRGHGLEFADAAIDAGAAAVAWDSSTGDASLAHGAVPFLAVDGLAGQLGAIANRWFGSPSEALDVYAVTGTNGKTTVAYLIAQCLQHMGLRCGYLGTLGYGVDDINDRFGLTTPPCIALHGALADMRSGGATHVAMEASSHALSQNRLDGVRLKAALFTNLSRDHVDYHGDMAAYAESKARLFKQFDVDHQIVCVDSEFGRQLAAECGGDVITTSALSARSARGHRNVIVRSAVASGAGSRVRVTTSWGEGDVSIPLAGEFNISNAIIVFALLLANGVSFDEAREALAHVAAPPGRMQAVLNGDDQTLPQVYVDYAHTPTALEVALQALRAHTAGRLWCVFGCGGNRDVGKRPLMGATVNRLADFAIVTNDNPRGESPQQIIQEVLAAMDTSAVAIEDRGSAIAYAIANAREGDTVLIAGKGHENYQIIGKERRDFSDYETARATLRSLAANGVQA